MSATPTALRWRRWPGPGWATYVADWPGPLGEDGTVVFVGRRDQLDGTCSTCGRRGQLWQAVLAVPAPFPGAVDAVGGGCSRAHAARGLPAGWTDVATLFALVAAALREDKEPTRLHEALARRRTRQAERALLLFRLERTARRMALELWRTHTQLAVDETEAIVAAVLAPAQR